MNGFNIFGSVVFMRYRLNETHLKKINPKV